MAICTIQGLRNYLSSNSGFTEKTVNNVIISLGYPLNGSRVLLSELSGTLIDCSKHGADAGFSGFSYYSDTVAFFETNKQDIVNHMETTAAELGMDIISMVQGFGVFCHSSKPTVSEVGKALWGSCYSQALNTLYNVFAWYALEEISHAWNRYLEDTPALAAKLSA